MIGTPVTIAIFIGALTIFSYFCSEYGTPVPGF